jgi:hypothetical protein
MALALAEGERLERASGISAKALVMTRFFSQVILQDTVQGLEPAGGG